MLIDGVILGTFTTLGFCLIYGRLPPWLKTWCLKHPLAVDIIVAAGFYSIMGMTLVAHFAVAAMVLEVQALLHIARNPEKFLFLQAAKQRAKESLKGLFDRVDEINEKWKRDNHVIDVQAISQK